MRTATIDGKAAYIFRWSVFGDDLFLKQQEIKKIEAFLNVADLETIQIAEIVIADEAVRKTVNCFGQAQAHVLWIRNSIEQNLSLLGLKQLRTIVNHLESLRRRSVVVSALEPAA